MKRSLLAIGLAAVSLTANADPEMAATMACVMDNNTQINLIVYVDDSARLFEVGRGQPEVSELKVVGNDKNSTMFVISEKYTGKMQGNLVAYSGGADLYLKNNHGKCK